MKINKINILFKTKNNINKLIMINKKKTYINKKMIAI
jgi:hypothetical protein